MVELYQVRQEAHRLAQVTRPVARAQFGDRVARTFQLNGPAFAAALDFNARLVTELRSQAESQRRPNLWMN